MHILDPSLKGRRLSMNSIYDFEKIFDVLISRTRNKKLEIICEFYFHNIVNRHFPI